MRIPFPFSRRGKKATGQGPIDPEAVRLLSGYVLHMSITSLGDGDITPLYEDYVKDPRLGVFGRRELTHAYQALQARAAVRR